MGVMAQLCKSAILLNKGSLAFAGNIGEVIESYVRQNNQNSLAYLAGEDNCRKDIFIKSVQLENKSGEISENFLVNENIYIKLVVGVNQYNSQACISITLQNMLGDYLSTFVETIRPAVNGEVALTIKLPANVIAPNTYAFRFATFIPNGAIFDLVDLACPIRVIDSGSKMALFDGVNYGSFIMNYEIV
jgi:lipopolysaccharide transport system ATP-binding protein